MRIIWQSIILVVFFTTSTGTAILIGRAQPLPEPLAMLHLTDCAPPCWIGIVPGKTTQEEAIRRIEAVFNQRNDRKLFDMVITGLHVYIQPDSTPAYVEIQCSTKGEIVYMCSMEWTLSSGTLGQLQALWGAPDAVRWDSEPAGSLMTHIYLHGVQINIDVSDEERLTPTTYVLNLALIFPEMIDKSRLDSLGLWRGFASLKKFPKIPPHYP